VKYVIFTTFLKLAAHGVLQDGRHDPILFWKSMNPEDPLTRLAIRLLSFTPQSADAERIFSVYVDTKTKKRTRLKLEKTRKMIFAKTELRTAQRRAGVTRKRLRRQFGNAHHRPQRKSSTPQSTATTSAAGSSAAAADVIEIDDSDDSDAEQPPTNVQSRRGPVGHIDDEDIARAIIDGELGEDDESEGDEPYWAEPDPIGARLQGLEDDAEQDLDESDEEEGMAPREKATVSNGRRVRFFTIS
jgi:hypothetical protein